MPYIAPSTAEQKIQAGYLARCSPQAAYDWLQARVPKSAEELRDARNVFGSTLPNLAEYVLMRRHEPLVDLGLARYAFTVRAVRKAFQRGGAACRIAAWTNVGANGSRFGSDIWASKAELERLVASGHEDELVTMAANPVLDERTLSALISKKEAFAGINERRWAVCLIGLSRNPRLRQEYGADRWMDGMAEYTHNKAFSEVWGLAATLPPNQESAQLLTMLLKDCRLPYGMDKQAGDLLARWNIDRERKPDDKYYNPGPSFTLRSRLADLLKPDQALLASDDRALRLSFWRRFDPKQHPSWVEDIERVFASETEDEVHDALTAAMQNDLLWHPSDVREALSSLFWRSPDHRHDMLMRNVYEATARRRRKEHPEWFHEPGSTEAVVSEWRADEAEPAWVSALVNRIDELPARMPVQGQARQLQEPAKNAAPARRPWWSFVPWWVWLVAGFLAAKAMPVAH